jgi:predicted nucleic acid-binding protein
MNKATKIFVDTDAFVGFVRRDDSHHKQVKQLFEQLKDQPVAFITSDYVFSESITVISQRVSHSKAVSFIETLQSLNSPYEIIQAGAIEIFKQQTSKNTSFVDCTNMAFLRQFHVPAIFSFDQTYKTNGFTLLEDFLREKQAA